MEVSIITGCYNERKNIENFVKCVTNEMEKEKIENFEIMIMDESTDPDTIEILNSFSENKKIRVIRNIERSGLLISEMEGISLASGNMKIIIDCDMQHNPKYIGKIIDGLKSDADCVIMSRFKEGGRQEMRFYRYILSITAGAISKIYIPSLRDISDPTSSFFGIKGKVRTEIPDFKGTKSLMLILALNPDLKVMEIPYYFQTRQSGKSKIMTPDIFYSFMKEVSNFRKIYFKNKSSKSGIIPKGLENTSGKYQKL
jgi:dolichol-phosphate mannosyltransferase